MRIISKTILFLAVIVMLISSCEMVYSQQMNIEIKVYPYKSPPKTTPEKYWDTLENILSSITVFGIFTDEFENFRKSNLQKPSVIRNTITYPQSGDLAVRGNVILIFESKALAEEYYSGLGQPNRNLRWAKGVIGIIESTKNPANGYSQIVSAQRLVINPVTNRKEVQNIRIRNMVNHFPTKPLGFYTLGPRIRK